MAAISAGLLLVVAFPLFILLIVGTLPGLTAWLIDPKPRRDLTTCVLSLNFAGVVPFLATVWIEGTTLSAMLQVLSEPFSWFAMYGGAAMGWVIYLGIPPLVAALRDHQADRRIDLLRAEQRDLIREWGKDLR